MSNLKKMFSFSEIRQIYYNILIKKGGLFALLNIKHTVTEGNGQIAPGIIVV